MKLGEERERRKERKGERLAKRFKEQGWKDENLISYCSICSIQPSKCVRTKKCVVYCVDGFLEGTCSSYFRSNRRQGQLPPHSKISTTDRVSHTAAFLPFLTTAAKTALPPLGRTGSGGQWEKTNFRISTHFPFPNCNF